ncbi:hypothetical protein IE4803_CH02571 [Rhizobium etli bv. phaseoli str. IE4803]|nr:hypothetical protein IE4803_CH02571 [Rhizobium etli bv. phaseoli str. IE4803]
MNSSERFAIEASVAAGVSAFRLLVTTSGLIHFKMMDRLEPSLDGPFHHWRHDGRKLFASV